MDFCEFKASVVYLVSSRTAREKPWKESGGGEGERLRDWIGLDCGNSDLTTRLTLLMGSQFDDITVRWWNLSEVGPSWS